MKRISTHILDLTRGRPAKGIPVRLEWQQSGGDWRELSSANTDQDGRCAQLLAQNDLKPGVYRLSFETGRYFAAQKVATLYPVIEVTFQIREGESHFHIPLLLSANGYTTYRGS